MISNPIKKPEKMFLRIYLFYTLLLLYTLIHIKIIEIYQCGRRPLLILWLFQCDCSQDISNLVSPPAVFVSPSRSSMRSHHDRDQNFKNELRPAVFLCKKFLSRRVSKKLVVTHGQTNTSIIIDEHVNNLRLTYFLNKMKTSFITLLCCNTVFLKSSKFKGNYFQDFVYTDYSRKYCIVSVI